MIKFPILDYYLNFFHTVLVTSHMRRRRSNLVINWIQDFITSRRYSLRVNLSYSLWSWVTSGIPQVSVLGPILFLLFINDLIERCAMYAEIYLFADDAKLFKHILSENDQEKLQDGCEVLLLDLCCGPKLFYSISIRMRRSWFLSYNNKWC